MISYNNIQRYDNLDFEEYLKLPGFSHSFLKREHNGIVEPLRITDNIIIGKLVDAILTDPASADMLNPLYQVAKLIAAEINKTFGSLISQFETQVSYTADMHFNGFKMQTTGRLDFLLPKHAVIDLKVTKSKESSIPGLIDYMGYKNQVWHYAKMAQVTKAYLMVHSIPSKSTKIFFHDCSMDHNEFFADKVISFGKIAA